MLKSEHILGVTIPVVGEEYKDYIEFLLLSSKKVMSDYSKDGKQKKEF